VFLKHLFYSAFKGITFDKSRGDIRYAYSDPDFNKNCLETVLRPRRSAEAFGFTNPNASYPLKETNGSCKTCTEKDTNSENCKARENRGGGFIYMWDH
jgi:hypothetical protein